jgi:hypothetical protein
MGSAVFCPFRRSRSLPDSERRHQVVEGEQRRHRVQQDRDLTPTPRRDAQDAEDDKTIPYPYPYPVSD